MAWLDEVSQRILALDEAMDALIEEVKAHPDAGPLQELHALAHNAALELSTLQWEREYPQKQKGEAVQS